MWAMERRAQWSVCGSDQAETFFNSLLVSAVRVFLWMEIFFLRTPELQVLHLEQTNWHWCCVFVCTCCSSVEPRRLRLLTP